MTHLMLSSCSTACGLRGGKVTPYTTTEWREVSCESCKRTARYKGVRSLEGVRDAAAWMARRDSAVEVAR